VSLPHLADLITYGEITVGVHRPIGCIATATDGDHCCPVELQGARCK